MVYREYCEIFKTTYFAKHLRTADTGSWGNATLQLIGVKMMVNFIGAGWIIIPQTFEFSFRVCYRNAKVWNQLGTIHTFDLQA